MKIHTLSVDKPEDYDLLALELELDINVEAEAIIKEHSPTGSR